MRKAWLALGVVVVLAAGGAAAWLERRGPEITPAVHGKEVAERMGCFGCHGPGGYGGIGDPLAPDGRVPDWDEPSAALYVSRREDIHDWIVHGAPRDSSPAASDSVEKRLVPMPSYDGFVSTEEVDALVAYFEAVSGWVEEMPDAAYEGRKIAHRLGCFGCHGPSGIGVVSNPGSFKGYIPPWDGEEFAELVRDEDELREWILEGRVERLWKNPAARFFLDRQRTPMPAYREHLSDHELDQLVAYIQWLRSR